MTKKIEVKDTRPSSEAVIYFEIETVMGKNPAWVQFQPSWLRKDGRFIVYHTDLVELAFNNTRVHDPEIPLGWTDEVSAAAFAKALARHWDRPLRVVRTQTIKLHRAVGKPIMPLGGVK